MQPTRDAETARRSVRGAGVDLSVVEIGAPDAPAAVIAHGVGSSARFVADAFGGAAVASGYRLVAYDLRGHGDSGPARQVADHRLERHAADLAAVVADVRARIVGGVSLGGHAAVTLAAERPVDGLIVCLPAWTGRAVPGEGAHAAVADEIRSVGVRRALERVTADAAVAGWLRDLLRRDWSAADPRSLEAGLLALDGARAPDEHDLRSVEAPAGIVAWPDDPGHPIEVARVWRGWLPHAVLEIVTMDEVGAQLGSLGTAAFRALARAGAARSR